MNRKIIAILVVAVLLATSAGVALLALNHQNTPEKYRSTDDTGRLMVFGNANNDDYLDSEDVTALEQIVAGTKDKTAFADANQDGRIDQTDIDLVEKMIRRESATVYYLNCNGEIKSCHFPVERIAALPNTTINMMKCIGATDKIAGICGGPLDPVLFSDVLKNAQVMSNSMSTINIEDASKANLDAVITDYNAAYVKNGADFEAAGIDVIRINAASGTDSLNYALTVGFLLDCQDTAQAFVKFSDQILSHVTDVTNNLKDSERATVLTVSMSNSIGSSDSASYKVSVQAGAVNLADWSGMTRKAAVGDEWILAEKYSSQFIAHTANYNFGTTKEEVQSVWDKFAPYFADTSAYKTGGYFIFNSNVPVALRVAYQAEVYYPDLFPANYAENLTQQWIDGFIENVHATGFKVGTDGVFLITAKMVKS